MIETCVQWSYLKNVPVGYHLVRDTGALPAPRSSLSLFAALPVSTSVVGIVAPPSPVVPWR